MRSRRSYLRGLELTVVPLIGATAMLPASLGSAALNSCKSEMAVFSFTADQGDILDVSVPIGSEFGRLLLIGLAPDTERPEAAWERLGGGSFHAKLPACPPARQAIGGHSA